MENPVGLRFRPTDEEMVDDYLRPKNLNRDMRYVDEVISTVTIRSFDPWELPSQSRIKLKDHVWCFFSPKENKYDRGERQIRKTKSGFWKITGKPKDIIGRNRQKIGHKRVLVFHLTNGGSNSDWVMHEYHLFSPYQMMAYTICKVMFKGDERNISSSSSSSSAGCEIENSHSSIPHDVNNSGGSEVTQSLNVNNSGGLSTETEVSSFHIQELQNPPQSSCFLDVQEDAPLVNANTLLIEELETWLLDVHEETQLDGEDVPIEEWEALLLVDDEQRSIMIMQDDRNEYRPQKPLTGVITDFSSDDNDSDSVSATTNSILTSSTCDSFDSTNLRIDQITNPQESPNSTIKLMSLPQEFKVSQALRTNIDTSEKKNPYDDARGTETGEHKLGQKTIKNKRAGFFYRIQKNFKKIQICSSISRT